MLKGRLFAASLILILIPYAVFSFYTVAAPSSPEDFLSNRRAHADCTQYTSPSSILQVSKAAGQFATVSSAVQAASPRDVIMVHPGIYRESVNVTKPCITIIGTDRRGTILDGGKSLANGIEVYGAAGVTVTNLTARNYAYNGVYYQESNDWTIRGVSSVNNGHYGLYTVASTYGTMSDDYTMGNGDSGFYIGEVFDCSCSIVNSTAYGNVLGYSGTRANGVTIRDSRFINNSVGIGPNTLLPTWSVVLSGQWKLPYVASNHTIVNNLVADNNNSTVIGVGISQTYGVPIGTGIFMTGTSRSFVSNNTVRGNRLWGIGEFTFLNVPIGNTYSANKFSKNGLDYFTDGTGFFGCSSGEQATGIVPPSCSSPSWLRLTLPNPYNELVLLESVGRPGLASDPPGIVLTIPLMFLVLAQTPTFTGTPSRGRRLASSFIDLLVAGDIYLLVVSLLAIFGFGASNLPDLAGLVTAITLFLSPLAYLILVTLWFFYGLVLESIRGATVGKWLVEIKMTKRDGSKAGFPRILLKNLLLYVDTLFFGLVGILSILLKHRTLGEIISGTSTNVK